MPFICHFKFQGETFQAHDVRSLTAFKDGFWISAGLQYDRYMDYDDKKYWIPPSKILHVEKEPFPKMGLYVGSPTNQTNES